MLDLAASPKTAEHISSLLVRYFVADEPPASVVDAVTKAWKDSDGDLLKVSQALINSEDALDRPRASSRRRSSTWSPRRVPWASNPSRRSPCRCCRRLARCPWDPPSPQGYDDRAATWLAPDAMTTRLDVAEQLAGLADPKIDPNMLLADITAGGASKETTTAVSRAESRAQGLAILLMSPEFQRT